MKTSKENLLALKGSIKHRFRTLKASVGPLNLSAPDHDESCEAADVDIAYIKMAGYVPMPLLALYQLKEKADTAEVIKNISAVDKSTGVYVFDPFNNYATETVQLITMLSCRPESISSEKFFRWGYRRILNLSQPEPRDIIKSAGKLFSADLVQLHKWLQQEKEICSAEFFSDGETRGLVVKVVGGYETKAETINNFPLISNINACIKMDAQDWFVFLEPTIKQLCQGLTSALIIDLQEIEKAQAALPYVG